MADPESVGTMIAYHLVMTRRVWELIEQISETQYLAEAAYSQGSIRNLMVHISSVDRRWMTGLKDLPDVGHVSFTEYPTRASGRAFFEQVSGELSEYMETLGEADLNARTANIQAARWQVLLHMVNHGTDHRATVLERLSALDIPTFPQDFILWLWKK